MFPLSLTSQQRKISQFITFSQQYFFSTHPCLPPPHRGKKLTSCQLILKQFIFPSPTCDFLLIPLPRHHLTTAKNLTINHFSHRNASFRLNIPTEKKLTKCHFLRSDFLFLLPHMMFLPLPFTCTSQSEKGSFYHFLATNISFLPTLRNK